MILQQERDGKTETDGEGERWSERVAVPEWLLDISILK